MSLQLSLLGSLYPPILNVFSWFSNSVSSISSFGYDGANRCNIGYGCLLHSSFERLLCTLLFYDWLCGMFSFGYEGQTDVRLGLVPFLHFFMNPYYCPVLRSAVNRESSSVKFGYERTMIFTLVARRNCWKIVYASLRTLLLVLSVLVWGSRPRERLGTGLTKSITYQSIITLQTYLSCHTVLTAYPEISKQRFRSSRKLVVAKSGPCFVKNQARKKGIT